MFEGFSTNEPKDRPGTAHNVVTEADGKTRSTTWQNADRWQRRLTRLDTPESLSEVLFDGLTWVSGMALSMQGARLAMVVAYGSSGLAWLVTGAIVTTLLVLVHWYAAAQFGQRAFTYRVLLTAISLVLVAV